MAECDSVGRTGGSQVESCVTHVGVSGVFGPAVDGDHDPLPCQRGRLARLNADPGDTPVGWGEEVARRLQTTQGCAHTDTHKRISYFKSK